MTRTPLLIHGNATSQHDGGVAVLLDDGDIVALASERITGRKHDGDSRPAYDVLRQAYPPTSRTADYFRDPLLDGYEYDHHHRHHAASAYFLSGFGDAAVLVVDGQGREAGKLVSTSIWRAEGEILTLVETDPGTSGTFHAASVGHFYTAVGAMAGMSALFEEGKTMALAAFGEPSEFLVWMRRYVSSFADGTYSIDGRFVLAMLGNTFGPRYYDWAPQPPEIQSIWREYLQLRSRPLRRPDDDPTHEDHLIAYAGQVLLEELVVGLALRAQRLTGARRLCLAGGVALNCPANSKIAYTGAYEEIFVACPW